jgi:hypothetical protein
MGLLEFQNDFPSRVKMSEWIIPSWLTTIGHRGLPEVSGAFHNWAGKNLSGSQFFIFDIGAGWKLRSTPEDVLLCILRWG